MADCVDESRGSGARSSAKAEFWGLERPSGSLQSNNVFAAWLNSKARSGSSEESSQCLWGWRSDSQSGHMSHCTAPLLGEVSSFCPVWISLLPHFPSVQLWGESGYVFAVFMKWKTAVRSHLAFFSLGLAKPVSSASCRENAPAPWPLQWYSTKPFLVL